MESSASERFARAAALRRLTVAGVLLVCTLAVAAWWRHDALPAGAARARADLAAEAALLGPSALRCNPRNLGGVGLRGEYFAQAGAKGAVLLSRVDSTVEFDASIDWPADRAGTRPRWARWQGWVKVPVTGRYRFHGGPAATISVAGLPMAGGAAAADASLDMTAGRFYPIVMEADLRGATGVRLEWTAPHGLRYVIPRALLFLPTAS